MTEKTQADKPALYCGTYGKYNNGSIAGKWLYLEDYADTEAFFAACRELHADESDPEYMFQDCEYIPMTLYGESLGRADVDKIYEWLEYDESDREIIGDYWDNVDSSADPERAMDCYQGNMDDLKGDNYYMDNNTAYGWYVIENGLFGIDIPDALVNYIDVEAVGREWLMDMTVSDNNNIFSNQ